jgi:hypothetical protein
MSATYLCLYRYDDSTQKYRLDSAHRISEQGCYSDPDFVKEVRELLVGNGFESIEQHISTFGSTDFTISDKVETVIDAHSESVPKMHSSYREYLFATYPEWFADAKCKCCRGTGSFYESHGNGMWQGEQIACDCTDKDRDLPY